MAKTDDVYRVEFTNAAGAMLAARLDQADVVPAGPTPAGIEIPVEPRPRGDTSPP